MASSSRSHSAQSKYDVFLSFRGEDTRDNFTSHLHAAFCRKNIKTFIDEELSRGDEISQAVLNAMKGSKISVIIFSKRYASSKWCLDELVEILECKNMNGQTVVPVFYQVDPSDVRNQTGCFADAFVEHEEQFKNMPEKVQIWRAVLTEASNLSGWPEAKLVEEIVKDILKKLENITVSTNLEGLVGLNSRIEQIKSLLSAGSPDFRIVGLWGMGGIGKTTIAGALFNQISREFEGKCFMASVREESEKGGGLTNLRERVVSEVLGEDLKIRTPIIPEIIKKRLQQMTVFIVLDDVNKCGQLSYLTGGLDRFGPGSRIIVTTRDKQVLYNFGVSDVYEVKGLEYPEALELFCNHAFKGNHCPEDLLVLSKRVLDYANGNPLALRVLGSFLHRKSKVDWKIALENLIRISDPDIYDVLKVTYNELKAEEKSMFLDIACFLKGEDKDYVTKIQDDPNFAHYCLSVLVDKSLVTISCNNKVQMHDLLQKMGREIVRQESVKEPGKRSRLWYYEDVYHVLKKNKSNYSFCAFVHKGTDAIEGVPIMSSKVHLDQGLRYLPEELRYLHWHQYSLKTLPLNFDPENLIELNLPYSNVEQIWEGKKQAFKLKFIDLHHSKYLTKIPDLVETPNLERINLLNCTNLPYISSSIQNFNNLSVLSLAGCRSLVSFPRNIYFRSPIAVDFSDCVNLTEFPLVSGNIIELRLWNTRIEEVPSSIECLTNLETLDLSFCKRLKRVSTSICKLKSLCWLELGGCSNLETFPEILEKMEHLLEIDLRETAIRNLPSSIEYLEGLRKLDLGDCSELASLPEKLENLKSLKYLNAEFSAIGQLPSSISDLNQLKKLKFSGCRGLVLPPLLSGLSSLTELHLTDCNITEIPPDIGSLSSIVWLALSGNHFERLPTSVKQLSQLRYLHLSNCNMLQSLPELPIYLVYLEAKNCKRLQTLPEIPSSVEELDASMLETIYEHSSGIMDGILFFDFTNCLKLNEKEAHKKILADSQQRIQHMASASLRLCYEMVHYTPYGLCNCFPGSEIPDWFSNQCSGSSLTIQLPRRSCSRNLVGFALCAVIQFEEDIDASGKYCNVKCSYNFETKTRLEANNNVDDYYNLSLNGSMDSDHVLLGFEPCWNTEVPDDGNNQTTISFEFSVECKNEKCHQVKCCGVCPVYANPNDNKPNTLKLILGSEEECTKIRILHDKVGMSGSYDDEDEMEPSPKRICRDQINTHQQ
ncbi:Disease resistance-like protein DSC1 [Citrus sinensis]|nr:Disease resistance-like protein DSC1 [Citrus sinensis]